MYLDTVDIWATLEIVGFVFWKEAPKYQKMIRLQCMEMQHI